MRHTHAAHAQTAAAQTPPHPLPPRSPRLPPCAQVHAGRAVCLFELGRTDESLAAFAKALGLAPADGEIRAQGEAVAAYAGKPAFFRSRQ